MTRSRWSRAPRGFRSTMLVGAAAALGLAAACTAGPSQPTAASHGATATPSSPSASPPASAAPVPWNKPLPANTVGHLAAGSHPSALPADLLIADKLNNRLIIVDPQGRIRWQFPRPGDLAPGHTFRIPDDAFFTPDGKHIIATEEDDFVIRVIDVAQHKIVYRYGKPGVHGSGPNRLWNPDDAVVLPGGNILTADIKNQRILLIGRGQHTVLHQWGVPGHGFHAPPHRYGAPNGVFPIPGGRFLVTEIRGSWVDAIDLAGHVFWSTHPPGVNYPSDTNQMGKNRYLTVDYSTPGQIVIFDRHGHLLWRYRPHGSAQLKNPSLALPVPNGDIVCNDDLNHRVIVVDPRTHKVVWQYGHTGVAGKSAGYLNNPDGVDLVPPNSLIDRTTKGAGSAAATPTG